MNYKSTLFCAFMLLTHTVSILPNGIKAICIDVEALFTTNEMQASNYVGKINALKYLKQMGHLPCQADLFKQLKSVPALSTQGTYNNNLDMPLVFSDWLLNLQSSSHLIKVIDAHLQKSKISAIEKTVHGNVAHMMLTPQQLADTQQVISPTLQLIGTLRKHQYQVYIVGNWSSSTALQQAFPQVFQQCNGIFFSGDMQQLKPYQEFYQQILAQTGLEAHEIVWVEKESKFIHIAEQYGLYVAPFNHKSPKALAEQLKKFQVKVA